MYPQFVHWNIVRPFDVTALEAWKAALETDADAPLPDFEFCL
jgi:hypothetical protein